MFNFKIKEIQTEPKEAIEKIVLAGKKQNPQNPQKERNTEPRKEDFVGELAVQVALSNFAAKRKNSLDTGFPIDEVVANINAPKRENNFQGGFASYWRLLKYAENGDLLNTNSDGFKQLRNACAEALVYKIARDSPRVGEAPILTAAFHDPLSFHPVTKEPFPIPFVLPDRSMEKPTLKKIAEVFNEFTPDVLVVSSIQN